MYACISNSLEQAELEGGRSFFWHWMDMKLLYMHGTNVLIPAQATKAKTTWSMFTYWFTNAWYFAVINLNLKLKFVLKASFSLLLTLLGFRECRSQFGMLRSQDGLRASCLQIQIFVQIQIDHNQPNQECCNILKCPRRRSVKLKTCFEQWKHIKKK